MKQNKIISGEPNILVTHICPLKKLTIARAGHSIICLSGIKPITAVLMATTPRLIVK